jgi:hypothetical protein
MVFFHILRQLEMFHGRNPMMSLPRLPRPITAALVVIGFLAGTAVPVAAATVQSQHGYAPAAATGAPVSPSGCYQHIDNPHLSYHYGEIAGELRTKCRNSIPQILQSAQLWERRWWGWDRVGIKGDKHVYWVSEITSWARVSCRKSSMKVTASGYVIDLDNRQYYASTASPSVNNPCNL